MRTSTFPSADHLSDATRDFLARRAAEVAGLLLIGSTVSSGLAMASWSIRDPSLNHAAGGPIHNLMGQPGAILADVGMQLAGVSVIAILTPLACWGWRLLSRKSLDRFKLRLGLLGAGAAIFGAVLAGPRTYVPRFILRWL